MDLSGMESQGRPQRDHTPKMGIRIGASDVRPVHANWVEMCDGIPVQGHRAHNTKRTRRAPRDAMSMKKYIGLATLRNAITDN